mgnify:FL=1
MEIAIIGSGMAGLAAARILQDAGHKITIFEALAGRGMDSHSLDFEGGIIDAPLRVLNPHLWRNTLSLATYLGIETFPVRTFMACSWLGEDNKKETWLTTSRSRIGNFPIITHYKQIQHNGWRLFKGLLQLRIALHQFFQSDHQDMSLAEFINQNNIDAVFWHGTVMPVLYTICTCQPKTLGEWPAKPLLEFIQQLMQGEALLRMKGGTSALVNRLIDGVEIHSGSAVQKVEQHGDRVLVENAQGISQFFDRVIIATPTPLIEQFLKQAEFAEDIALLKKFKFEQGDLVVHTDPIVMPSNRQDWAVLSYAMDRNFSRQQFTVWLNKIEPTLVNKSDVFQTWCPVDAIDPKKIISKARLTRAVVDSDTVALNKIVQQRHLQQNRKVFYCGSWSCDGMPILESAVTSAMHISTILGAPIAFLGLKPNVNIAPELGY